MGGIIGGMPDSLVSYKDPISSLSSSTAQAYPFIKQNNPVLVPTSNPNSETWPAGEEGTPDYPRPASIPMNQHGIEITPGMTPDDIAGEVLHVDPYANQIRSQLQASWTPEQIAHLKRESLDYGQDGPTVDYMPPERRLQNATDSAIRGTVVNQWPAEANRNMNYTAHQQLMLDRLKQYMTTGKMPTVMLPPQVTPQSLQNNGPSQ